MITVIRKKLYKTGRKVLIGLLTTAMLAGCNVWEDLPECPPEVTTGKVWFTFSFTYHNTKEENEQYKELFGETALRTDLFIFDKSGTLVKRLSDLKGPFTNDYRLSAELPAGEYRAVAWNNLSDAGYTSIVPDAIEGVTHIDDLAVQLTELNKKSITLQPATLLFGETEPFTLTSGSGYETDKIIPIPLMRDTHKVNFAISWRNKKTNELCPFWTHADSTRIYIDDTYGSIDFGNNLQSTDAFTYIPHYLTGAQATNTNRIAEEEQAAILRAGSSMLRLLTTSGHVLRICRVQTDGSEKEVYRKKLMGDLISQIYDTQEKIDRQGVFNIGLEFECEHPDGSVDPDDPDKPSKENWMSLSITINGWKLSNMGDIEP